MVEFQNLKNSFPETTTTSDGKTTALDEILDVIENHTDIKNNKILKQYFWDIFIVDALIGNYDRHNGNWGILVNDETQEVKMAPIYDCVSCLCSQLTDEQMKKILENKAKLNNRIYNRPTSTITENDKRINYYDFISSLKNKDCNAALERVYSKIDMNKIEDIIDNMPIISKIRKRFYKEFLKGRYEIIIKKSVMKVKK